MADITYIPSWEGFLFLPIEQAGLSVVLDAWSRRVVGWATAAHLQQSRHALRTELVVGALDMALGRRCPSDVIHHDVIHHDVIHHSDRGCQYTSIAFGKRCWEAGVTPSMGSVGDCYERRRSVAG